MHKFYIVACNKNVYRSNVRNGAFNSAYLNAFHQSETRISISSLVFPVNKVII